MQRALFKDISNITLLFVMDFCLIKFWFSIGDKVEWQIKSYPLSCMAIPGKPCVESRAVSYAMMWNFW